MEVSDRLIKNVEQGKPSGTELLQTVVTLTGLPEPLISQELNQILALTGSESSELTLDQLRHAMVAYLEALQPDLCDLEDDSDSLA